MKRMRVKKPRKTRPGYEPSPVINVVLIMLEARYPYGGVNK